MKKTKIFWLVIWCVILIVLVVAVVYNKGQIQTWIQSFTQNATWTQTISGDVSVKILKREDVGPEFKRNLNEIFANTGELKANFAEQEKLIAELTTYKWKMADDVQLLKYLQLDTTFMVVNDRAGTYINLWGSVDTKNTDIDGLRQQQTSITSRYSQSTAFFLSELKEFSDAKLDGLIANPKFADYKNTFIDMKIQKKHILPEAEYQLVSQVTAGRIASSDIRDSLVDGDIVYPVITNLQWSEVATNYANMYAIWGGQTQEIRSKFTNLFYTTYAKYKRTLGALLASHIKEVTTESKVYKYDSVLKEIYDNRQLPVTIYDTLLSVTKKNLPIFHRYMQMKKDYFWLSELHYYDTLLPMIDSSKSSFTYAQAQGIVLSWLAKLWPKYEALLRSAFTGNRIDVYQSDNKAWWAFSTTYYGGHPFVSIGFNNTFGDIKTLAHELWHAMNFSLAMAAQPIPMFGTSYPWEIPSITNELILLRGLADSATWDEQKLLYLDQYLDTITTNYWRATMYGDFDKQMYDKAWNDEPITTDLMDQTFSGLFRQYYWPAFTYDDYLSSEWAIKPHFYSVYYQHVYALSVAAANKIATELYKWTTWFADKYIAYLSMGDNGMPTEQLATLGIDMTKPDYLQSISDTEKEILDQMDVLIARIKAKTK